MQESQTLNAPTPSAQNPSKRKRAPLFLVISILLLFAGSGYGLFSLAQLNSHMAEEVESLKQDFSRSQIELKNLSQATQHWQSNQEQLKTLNQKQIQLEMSLQQIQPHGNQHLQFSIIKDYITLAEQALQISRDPDLAQHYLQLALDALEKIPASNTLALKNQIHAMLAQLDTLHPNDLAIAQRNLILLQTHLQQVHFTTSATPNILNLKSSEKNTLDLAFHTFIQSLKNFVTIRHQQHDAPLRLPEERFALMQNLNQQLGLAQLALTQHNSELFNACLQNLQSWIIKYADTKHPLTLDLLSQIQQLKQTPIQLPQLNFSQAQQLLAALDQAGTSAPATLNPQNSAPHASTKNNEATTHALHAEAKPTALAAVKTNQEILFHKIENKMNHPIRAEK